MKSTALNDIRRQNILKILDLLTFSPAMTRQELAEATHVSLMTVTNLVDVLKEQAVLSLQPLKRDHGLRPTTGRKADAITLTGKKKAWLLIDLSTRDLRALFLGFDCQPLLELKEESHGHYLERLDAFLTTLNQRMEKALKGRELLGVAAISPGPYDLGSDTITNQRITELNGIAIKALLRERLGGYRYFVTEDVKFAIHAFAGQVEVLPHEVLYYLFIGEGVGGSAVHSGTMIRGLNATAGDAGQLPDSRGRTFESRMDVFAFAQMLGLDPQMPLQELTAQLQALAAEKPENYLAALETLAEAAADMLYDVLWLLDPSHVIVDCRHARPFGKEFCKMMEEALARRFAGTGRLLPQITPSPKNTSTILRGAIRVLQQEWVKNCL